jgi:hypothetical protein
MNALVPAVISNSNTGLVTEGESEFSKTKRLKTLMKENPHMTKREVSLMVKDEVRQIQPQAAALVDRARTKGYDFTKVKVSKSGGLYFTLTPPPKAVRTANLSKASNDEVLAEAIKRGLIPA